METDLTGPQSEFFHSDATYVAAVAGFGSGKTMAAATRLLATKLNYPTIDVAYLAPTYSLIRDIFYPYMSEFLHNIGANYSINKSDNVIHINGYGLVYCRTMDNPDLIVGWQVGDAFLDEFDILPIDKAIKVMQKVSARCRQKFPDKKKNQKYITTTPEGFKATYKLFKKEPLQDSHLIQMSTTSNAHNLPDDYIQSLRDQYPAELIDAYIDGKFVNLTSGAVYNHYDCITCNSTEEIKESEPLFIGMDFNVTNMSAVIYVKRGKVWHAVDELVGVYDTPSMIDLIKYKYKGHHITVYPDASGRSRKTIDASTSDIALLEDAKFSVRANKKNPYVRDRIVSANSAFNNGLLKVNADACPEYANCLEQLVYNKNGEPDKDSDLDHLPDAGTYPIAYEMPVVKPLIDMPVSFSF